MCTSSLLMKVKLFFSLLHQRSMKTSVCGEENACLCTHTQTTGIYEANECVAFGCLGIEQSKIAFTHAAPPKTHNQRSRILKGVVKLVIFPHMLVECIETTCCRSGRSQPRHGHWVRTYIHACGKIETFAKREEKNGVYEQGHRT